MNIESLSRGFRVEYYEGEQDCQAVFISDWYVREWAIKNDRSLLNIHKIAIDIYLDYYAEEDMPEILKDYLEKK